MTGSPRTLRRALVAGLAGMMTAFALAVAFPALAEEAAGQAGVPVSEEQALAALTEALRYAEAGVPFKLGGRITVDEYLALRDQDPEKAASGGIDASGLVCNAYRAAIPNLKFFGGPPGQAGLAAYVTSRTLYRYNVSPVTLEAMRPGDLLFFKSPQSGDITGVAIVAARAGKVVRVVVASASRGKVVETGINTEGTYWATQVAGLGRLLYPAELQPAATAP